MKYNLKKRILSFALALTMMFSMLPTTALPVYAEEISKSEVEMEEIQNSQQPEIEAEENNNEPQILLEEEMSHQLLMLEDDENSEPIAEIATVNDDIATVAETECTVTDNVASIDASKCVSCGVCASSCPQKVIKKLDNE